MSVRCPNCGQKTRGEYCQWCKYPILRGGKTKQQEAEKKAKREAELQAKEIDSEVYEGNVQIVIPSPVRFEQVEQFKECLDGIDNLAIVWTGGSADEGSIIGVSVQKPMALIRNLNEIPTVNNVYKKGRKIVVMLSTASGD